ncbi:MAG TPA: cell filamentation protein Fic [Campylobacterales bacterium]|nr:cell filamentation protein Fic [Campylobacterales bacterium]
MMSKYRFNHSSIYIDGTDIPRNKLEIDNSVEIHDAENLLLEEAYIELTKQLTQNSILDETYFINLHKKTFESLYDFAGIYRDVNMSKGNSQFCLAQYLHNESARIFKELEEENYLTDIKEDKALFAKRLAYYQGELIALHPFYELNGRITRLYCDMLTLFNGYKVVDYSAAIDNGAYIEASIECVQYADSSLLDGIIFEGLCKFF